MNKQPLLSVIIPVYNTEKYFSKCIESILECSYKNIEVIIVNDCSKGNIDKLASEYTRVYDNVKYVKHEKNKGLFHAKITGISSATGDYIAFVDSDDYVGVDFYRLLIKEAEEGSADIVSGNTVEIWNEDRKVVRPMAMERAEYTGDDIYKHLFRQEGQNYYYHITCNKIYKKSIWDLALPELKKQTEFLIMTEDILFSTIIHYYAKKIIYTTHDAYFYCRHQESSSLSATCSIASTEKNLRQIRCVFDFVESFLKDKKIYDTYKKNFLNWKKQILLCYFNDDTTKKIDKNLKKSLLKEDFTEEDIKAPIPGNGFFYFTEAVWDDRFENLKKTIVDSKPKYVSFDVFDTLLLRPFEIPSDLFAFMNKTFLDLTDNKSFLNFNEIRISAEEIARSEKNHKKWKNEEVTLKEIYAVLNKTFLIKDDVCEKLMQLELKLEQKFCYTRKTGFEIYELAKAVGAEIYCISDMYLSEKQVQNLVYANGYTDIKKVYVSSEYGMTKWTGSLYEQVKNDLQINKKSKIIHVGDNYYSDVTMAEKNGFTALHLPKATDAMNEKTGGILHNLYREPVGSNQGSLCALSFKTMRCIKGLIANRYFDNPFVPFQYNSDYNSDAFLIGYAALGPAVFGVVKWLLEKTTEKNYSKLQFMARDGYLPLKIYELLSPYYKNAPEPGYFYMSRKSIMPFLVRTEQDIFQLHRAIQIYSHTSKEFVEYIFEPEDVKDVIKILEASNIPCDQTIRTFERYYELCEIICRNVFPKYKVKQINPETVKMFKNAFPDNSAYFDVGYSGRPGSVICGIVNHPVDAYFLHINSDEGYDNSGRNNFDIQTFYNYTPSIIGGLREHLISSTENSCIGYDKDGSPVFDNEDRKFTDVYILNLFHKGAIKFTEDFLNFFGDFYNDINVRSQDLTFLYDEFLNHPREIDMQTMKGTFFQDETGLGEDLNLYDFWLTDLAKKNMFRYGGDTSYNLPFALEWLTISRKNHIKLLAYALFDRDTLKAKIKNKLQDHPVCLFLICGTYKVLRKIKRIFIPRRK